ncbi:hypothetical protein EMIHUDRAFT_233605 [Emiliania huxleyi CCMP1516]|uniref:Uncharacterized protein n=2 Tax=Emiliania huxleyi TaxID=2903 RepID=A0A0D3K1S2_EMIH1|nr:hypothetical protein EMIHUDRAFT_233605 [Emiliania huxleyi CCMP1516]EOD29707.1 hypothetical protein EMIHUDRAFT_233605 [Emiliania huxleyi CCMP1516]|eukprot:XP_005782136.1 hypothetical protein EMIHUDRAFT_233605 [Emiliania huxleyi CCMP1516]
MSSTDKLVILQILSLDARMGGFSYRCGAVLQKPFCSGAVALAMVAAYTQAQPQYW